ncbi:hypothetical protein NEMBOFW57_003112 [Staphylotrichum longicolle]|uniref:Yeast cell wall synthesis Kre9/Knh1-like N-terminal domain-containing protein n=1 Tax=Staphylotrichum longicolle TaxID=669026 RepID=A0AAD4F4B7_9PEZI|nr:hypothetical protein NEMBOFW57_003112 [Staphylotrichum longicolle]
MTKIIFTGLLAAFATVAQAVKLTNSDWNVVAGEAFTIRWTDAEGGVSIRLKSGPANSLQTVQEIASGQSGESLTWTVPTNLDTAQYAIEIEDGSGSINYSVQFSISGDMDSQTTGSPVKPTTTTATAPVPTPSTRANASLTSTPTSEAKSLDAATNTSEAVSKTEVPEGSVGDSTGRETRDASTLASTRANRPSATASDTAESGVPNAGATGHSASALMGAVLGAWLLA